MPSSLAGFEDEKSLRRRKAGAKLAFAAAPNASRCTPAAAIPPGAALPRPCAATSPTTLLRSGSKWSDGHRRAPRQSFRRCRGVSRRLLRAHARRRPAHFCDSAHRITERRTASASRVSRSSPRSAPRSRTSNSSTALRRCRRRRRDGRLLPRDRALHRISDHLPAAPGRPAHPRRFPSCADRLRTYSWRRPSRGK